MPDARYGSEHRPIAAVQTGQRLQQHPWMTANVENLDRRRYMGMLDAGGLGETAAKLVGVPGDVNGCLGQVSQDRLPAAARIENAIDGLLGSQAQAIDYTQRSENQAVEVLGLDEGHLVE